MNLFLVRGTWEIPIAAKDADSAERVASGLLAEADNRCLFSGSLGFSDIQLSSILVDSIEQVPLDWVSCPLFNDNDLDDLYAADILNDSRKKEIISNLYNCIDDAKKIGLSYSEIKELIKDKL